MFRGCGGTSCSTRRGPRGDSLGGWVHVVEGAGNSLQSGVNEAI